MRWRLVRNRQRLSRMENSASVCQRAFRSFLARTLTRKLREQKAALFFQRHWRGYICRAEAETRRQEQWAAGMVQRRWRGLTGRRNFEMRVEREDAIGKVQRNFRGKRAKDRVRRIRNNRERAALLVQNQFRARMARDEAWRRRSYRRAAVTLQRIQRGIRGRKRAQRERDRFLFSKAQSQGIEFGRQMLMEHRLHGTRLQSEVALLVQQKAATEEDVEELLSGIARCKAIVVGLEREMHELSRVEMEMSGSLTQAQRTELREQKMRLDREFGEMLTEITNKQRVLDKHELSLQKLERERELKEGELRDLERKLVVLLEEQQSELHHIKARQEQRDELLLDLPQVGGGGGGAKAIGNGGGSKSASPQNAHGGGGGGAMVPGGGGGGGGWQGPTPQQRQEAAELIGSTETLMKFGFMSMSLTYFSSLNMIQAIKSVGALETGLAGAHADKQALISGGSVNSAGQFVPALKPGQSSAREAMDVSAWSVADVGEWLGSLSLAQYSECFADAAIDGGFLYDLTDEDLANTLNIEHALHRKKIINSIGRLRKSEEAKREAAEQAKYAASQVADRIPGLPGSTGIGARGGGRGGGNAGVASAAAALALQDGEAGAAGAPMASLMDDEELFTLCRHGKVKALEQALEVRVPFSRSLLPLSRSLRHSILLAPVSTHTHSHTLTHTHIATGPGRRTLRRVECGDSVSAGLRYAVPRRVQVPLRLPPEQDGRQGEHDAPRRGAERSAEGLRAPCQQGGEPQPPKCGGAHRDALRHHVRILRLRLVVRGSRWRRRRRLDSQHARSGSLRWPGPVSGRVCARACAGARRNFYERVRAPRAGCAWWKGKMAAYVNTTTS